MGGCKTELRWSKERTERFAVLWSDINLSASVIAAELGISRSAVLGKAHRANFPPRGKGIVERRGNGDARALTRAAARALRPPPEQASLRVQWTRRSPSMSKCDLRALLFQAVMNTAAMQVSEAS